MTLMLTLITTTIPITTTIMIKRHYSYKTFKFFFNKKYIFFFCRFDNIKNKKKKRKRKKNIQLEYILPFL